MSSCFNLLPIQEEFRESCQVVLGVVSRHEELKLYVQDTSGNWEQTSCIDEKTKGERGTKGQISSDRDIAS